MLEPGEFPMSDNAKDSQQLATATDGYDREVRFAVVMYGGVSLAIYINGVAQELLRLVRSTSPSHPTPNGLTGTERVYRKVAKLFSEEGGASSPLNTSGAPGTRFVIDIISGTSAGGINGVFLAKALANGLLTMNQFLLDFDLSYSLRSRLPTGPIKIAVPCLIPVMIRPARLGAT
jgi:predicted acylesterase/phospholipase RssA